jgi:hypothetical protein
MDGSSLSDTGLIETEAGVTLHHCLATPAISRLLFPAFPPRYRALQRCGTGGHCLDPGHTTCKGTVFGVWLPALIGLWKTRAFKRINPIIRPARHDWI